MTAKYVCVKDYSVKEIMENKGECFDSGRFYDILIEKDEVIEIDPKNYRIRFHGAEDVPMIKEYPIYTKGKTLLLSELVQQGYLITLAEYREKRIDEILNDPE